MVEIPVSVLDMSNDKNAIIARMIQPETLRSEAFQPWCHGRGTDVWAMLCACITGDMERVKQLLAKDPGLIQAEYEYFKPLHFAVREGHRELVHFLLEKGADPNNAGGDPLVTMARDRGYTDLAELFESILQNKFHIVPEGTVIANAIKAYDLPAVRRLLKERPELLHVADEHGNQPIHWAVLTRQIDLIDYLLELGADINTMRPDGARPIDLTNGDYFYRSWYRDLPPTALQRHEVLLGYLIARGAYLDISVAAKIGYLDRVRELLDEDPSLVNKLPVYCGYYSGLPLRNAAGAGHIEVVKLLLERGANLNEPEPDIAPHGGSLFAAIQGKHVEIIKLLLEHGANPNASVESSGNCMSIAKHVGASREIQNLIASFGGVMGAGFADVETLAAMLHANPQLRVDANLGDPQILRLILRYQPNYLKREIDQSAWWDHGTAKSPEHARWLIEQGLDPRMRNWLGINILHRCAVAGDKGVAAVCLEYGADINVIETEWCSTPMGWAARHGKTDMVAWLLQQGADPNLPANMPWALPLAWAKRRGNHEIVQLLEGITNPS